MFVAEIKEALQALSPEELADVAKAISSLGGANEPVASIRELTAADPRVPAAMDAVFEKHGELLRRLAQ